MMEFFRSGGVLMWPLVLIGVGVLALSARAGWALANGGDAESARGLESTLRSILFWGAMSVVLGLLGTLVGIVQMAHAVTLAGGAEPPLVWGGVAVSLVTLIFGTLILLTSLALWFTLSRLGSARLGLH